MRIVRGNWVGAAATAFTGAFVAGLMGLGLALLAKPVDFGLGNTLTLATVIADGAFGADLRASGTSSGLLDADFEAFVGIFPLTVTLVALAAAVLVFRRVTRGYASEVAAFGDAVRAALLFGIMLWVPALLFSTDNDELGRGWGADLSSRVLNVDVEAGAQPAAALFLGMLVMLLALGISLVLRRDWDATEASTPLASAAAQGRSLLRAPLAGAVTMTALLPVAGLIGLVSMALFGEDTHEELDPGDTRSVIALCVAFLANGGMWVMSLGSGSRLGSTSSSSDGPSETDWSRLWGSATEQEPGLWVSPVALLAVLAVAAFVVIRSAERGRELLALTLWIAGLLVTVPYLVRVTSLHAHAVGTGAGQDFDGSVFAGADGPATALMVFLVGAVVAFVVAVLTGVLTPAALRSFVAKASYTERTTPEV